METEFQYIDTTGANLSGIKRKIEIDQEKQAPVKKEKSRNGYISVEWKENWGDFDSDTKSVGKMQFKHAFAEIFQNFLL